MENASKALIIAGAILLAILLISLGIYVFTGAQDTVQNSGLESQEASTFNSALVKYEGSNKSASDVRSVKNEVIAANRKLNAESMTAIKINNANASQFDTSALVDSKKQYKIKLDYNETTGYVIGVQISGPKTDGTNITAVETTPPDNN